MTNKKHINWWDNTENHYPINKGENKMTLEQITRKLEEIKVTERRIAEKELGEMLKIFEYYGYILPAQDICFNQVMKHYDGERKQEFLQRYKPFKESGIREECIGL